MTRSAASQPLWGIYRETDVMVPMRDGMRLATAIYRPAHEAREEAP